MGLIKAFAGAVSGELASQWLEAIESAPMSNATVMTKGVRLRQGDKRDSNKKGQTDLISNGSKILVGPNQFMLLLCDGKIVDYTAEPGGYTVNDAGAPSLFNGELKSTLKDTFERFKFGGGVPHKQEAFFINMQEIREITFGTSSPVNYFDNFYNAELYLRANGFYSIKVEDPIMFFMEVIGRDAENVDFSDIKAMFTAEFMSAFTSSLNQMSADGFRISHIASKTMEFCKYMADILDEDWLSARGFAIKSVAFNAITYDDESKKLIAIRSQGAMLQDANLRESYVQQSVARGIEAAGSNEGGATNAFLGMGMGMNTAGLGQMSANNQSQIQQQQAAAAATHAASTTGEWTCLKCGVSSGGKFCQNCGEPKPAPAGEWVCPGCSEKNTGKFCQNCGGPKPATACPKCGAELSTGAKFCPECGEKL